MDWRRNAKNRHKGLPSETLPLAMKRFKNNGRSVGVKDELRRSKPAAVCVTNQPVKCVRRLFSSAFAISKQSTQTLEALCQEIWLTAIDAR